MQIMEPGFFFTDKTRENVFFLLGMNKGDYNPQLSKYIQL